ncbi:hypothetical protein RO575_21705 [Methylomonas sp. MO1]|uniref:hypothetical protein n=1 Tax=Methylomonas sp. MO1 TaxID=3073619 RepID=UPI0028A31F41|nr:hypothetical protein [Methylomonas sp. MO1]MDT4292189.1 hypothetical protein [Methylomonas sp. MO1]
MTNPLIGRDCSEILPGYRKLPVGKHLVFIVKKNPIRLKLSVFFIRTWIAKPI